MRTTCWGAVRRAAVPWSPAATATEMEFQLTMVARIPAFVGLSILIGFTATSRPLQAQATTRADSGRAHVYGGEPFRLDGLMPVRRGNARISLFHRPPDETGQTDELRGGDQPFRFRSTTPLAKRTGDREGSGLVNALADLLIP